MRCRYILHAVLGLGALIFLLGCSNPRVPATDTPVPFTPTPAYRFQPGHYIGEPDVSFDVTEDERIENFVIQISFGMSTCTITLKEDAVVSVAENGSFIVFGSEGDADGNLPMNSIVGEFTTPTSVEGAYSNAFLCEDQLNISSNTGVWSAHLEGTESAAAVPGAAVVEPTTALANDMTEALLLNEFQTSEWVGAMEFTPDGATLVAGLIDGSLELLNPKDGTSLQVLPGHTGGVECIAFSPDGQYMATGAGEPSTSEDPTVRIWSTTDWTQLHTLPAGGAYSLAFSPDGTLLATGSRRGAVHIWRVSDGTELQTLEGHELGVDGVAFSPDGTLLASGGYDDIINIWQVRDGTLMRTLEPEEAGFLNHFSSFVFMDNGETLAAHNSNDVYLWQVSDGAFLRNISVGSAENIAYSPDGELIASVSYEGQVDVWQTSDGNSLASMFHSAREINFLIAFAPDGESFATLNGDLVRVWQVPSP